MTRKTIWLAATILGLPIAATGLAQAQPVNGLYVGSGVGYNYQFSTQVRNIAAQPGLNYGGLPVPNKSIDFGSSIAVVGSLGYGFGNGLRVELEGNYRSKVNGSNGSKMTTATTTVSGGGEQKAGAMVNVLYDFTDLIAPGVTPYLGAGLGWNNARITNVQATGLIPAGLPSAGQPFLFRFNNGQNALAYQAILGLSYNIASVPGMALTGEVRYFGLGGTRTYKGQALFPNYITGARVQLGNENNISAMIGVRYAFNAAPPPAPPAPPPPRVEAARTYLVFFDWDKYNLTDRARQIIAEAAQATTRVQVTRIEVSGHTDTTGTAKYNQALSVRRADAVAAELVRLGVPRTAITAQGFGFTRLLVPTGPNVREPQNRRVEIVLK